MKREAWWSLLTTVWSTMSGLASQASEWQVGGFTDVGYLLNLNHPANKAFRSRGTTWRTDAVHLNMSAVCLRKESTADSRWGIELTGQFGKDTELFGFSATAPAIRGYRVLRQLGPTNVSYLAPVGGGVQIQGGIFGSLVGYDSLYAKDNLTYTRPWGADFTPYLMMGMKASSTLNRRLSTAVFVINGYWHLANANRVPSWGGQLVWAAGPQLSVRQTVLTGPHQPNTALEFWRFLSDTIVERRTERRTVAVEYIYSSERVDSAGRPRAQMMSSQLVLHGKMGQRWGVTVRPEVFWDSAGRWTLSRQTVKAVTTSLEYRIPYRSVRTVLRLEHRYDDSRGPEGGFFRGAELSGGGVALTPGQHLVILGVIFSMDSNFRP